MIKTGSEVMIKIDSFGKPYGSTGFVIDKPDDAVPDSGTWVKFDNGSVQVFDDAELEVLL